MRLKKSTSLTGLVSLAVLAALSGCSKSSEQATSAKRGPSSIGGTVVGPSGPEAGVWVIAESTDLENRLIKIVVTDDEGRFLVPDLPSAKYKVWARGYGLKDSAPLQSVPGGRLKLQAAAAASESEAAQIYPANYWFSLVDIPPASDFPGTGPKGNGIDPAMTSQQSWIAHMVENCQFCHQLGTKKTREVFDMGNPVAAWQQRILMGRSPDDVFDDENMPEPRHARNYGKRMQTLMSQFGEQRGLSMFADWTTRIAKGETPPAPERPAGVERNLVITLRDMGSGRFLHDSSSSDKRNPTVNANGPVFGYGTFSGMIVALDPETGKQREFRIKDAKGDWFVNGHPHTGTLDSKGRVWTTDMTQFGGATLASAGANPSFCTDPSNKFAKYFPRESKQGRNTTVLDPKTGKDELVPLCYGPHHLNFDKDERLYFSGDTEVVGWLDVNTWDQTKDASKAVGWCPLVLDTNGDGKITPDRDQWNLRLEGVDGGEGADMRPGAKVAAAPLDPSKDTRIAGFNYGMGISPKDQSYWSAKYSPLVPSGVLRLETGTNPPETCKTEYYEVPKVDGEYPAYNIRGVDVDADGVTWVAFGSGAIGRFDRSQCKVLNGPTATGQHCPEGWEIIPTPGPKFKGTDVASDWFYLATIDHHNTLGLGKGVPVFPNSVSDELLAYLPKEKRFVHLRVPYPLGFYPRLVDGRIDDEGGGWKGRGLWASNNLTPLWHQETGEGSVAYAAHFQLRPDPLAE